MEYRDLIDRLDPALVERLRRAVATGRWPDGRAVTGEQREASLQAIIAWESARLPEDERTGYIDRGRKAQAADNGGAQPVRWLADQSGACADDGDGREDNSRRGRS